MPQPQPVMILHAGSWRPGQLLAWRSNDPDNGRWRAYVTYTVGVGQKYLLWIDGERVRRTEHTSDTQPTSNE